jgi:hypothetical protein
MLSLERRMMMKKVLVFMLVLGLASSANAIVIQISVDGDPDPVDSQIVLEASQELVLDVHSPSGHSGGAADDIYWAMIVDPLDGSISGGALTAGAPDASSVLGQDLQSQWPGWGSDPATGPWGAIASYGAAFAPGTYIDQLIFHCERGTYPDPVDTTVLLLQRDAAGTVTVADSLIIHQIPEPMTIALLGLGGLALLRRRK